MSFTPSTSGALPGQALREAHPPERTIDWLDDARRRSLSLIDDLDDDQLAESSLLRRLAGIGWFAERWLLRRHGQPSLLSDTDPFLSAGPVHSRQQILAFLREVHERILDLFDRPTIAQADTYFVLLAIFHEDMHGERIVEIRQALGYPSPTFAGIVPNDGGRLLGDATVSGGRFLLGAMPGEAFVYDNEKWAHPVDVRPFAISRTPVTQAEFAAFVKSGGYAAREFWSDAGRAWRDSAAASHPLTWRHDGDDWQRRAFERWLPLEDTLPVHQVCWFEAEAYCRWARRRLPTEAEWEVASASWPAGVGLSSHKRRFPWGEESPVSQYANLDGRTGCLAVDSCPDGDSAWGCRQMIGNVWEWTASEFQPYPGFAVDPCSDYSRSAFGTHKVLRGGSWLTRGRMLRNTWRYFLRPDRRDVWAGFRTCALM